MADICVDLRSDVKLTPSRAAEEQRLKGEPRGGGCAVALVLLVEYSRAALFAGRMGPLSWCTICSAFSVLCYWSFICFRGHYLIQINVGFKFVKGRAVA
jgi:hypothetical protein